MIRISSRQRDFSNRKNAVILTRYNIVTALGRDE